MRKVLAFAIAACVCIASCSKEAQTVVLGIDAQATFTQDHVQVFLDTKEIINDTLTSSPVITLCANGRFLTNISTGNHILKVIVNGTVQSQHTFNIAADHYIGITYAVDKIDFISSDKPFNYR